MHARKTHWCVQSDLQRQSGAPRRDPGICCCEKASFAVSSSGCPSDVSGQAAALARQQQQQKEVGGKKACLCGVTHLVGVLRVELGLHILLLLFLGRSWLAALAGGGPPLPLHACKHTIRARVSRRRPPAPGAEALMRLGS